jgi:hypothetical protein
MSSFAQDLSLRLAPNSINSLGTNTSDEQQQLSAAPTSAAAAAAAAAAHADIGTPPPPTLSSDARSMRTSSFAMSDMSEFAAVGAEADGGLGKQSTPLRKQHSGQHMESLRLRKAYSQGRKPVKWRNGSSADSSIPETENLDYLDEKDFRNTDRYCLFHASKRGQSADVVAMAFCRFQVQIVRLLITGIGLLCLPLHLRHKRPMGGCLRWVHNEAAVVKTMGLNQLPNGKYWQKQRMIYSFRQENMMKKK